MFYMRHLTPRTVRYVSVLFKRSGGTFDIVHYVPERLLAAWRVVPIWSPHAPGSSPKSTQTMSVSCRRTGRALTDAGGGKCERRQRRLPGKGVRL